MSGRKSICSSQNAINSLAPDKQHTAVDALAFHPPLAIPSTQLTRSYVALLLMQCASMQLKEWGDRTQKYICICTLLCWPPPHSHTQRLTCYSAPAVGACNLIYCIAGEHANAAAKCSYLLGVRARPECNLGPIGLRANECTSEVEKNRDRRTLQMQCAFTHMEREW